MCEEIRKRVIAGIALINLSIFMLSAFWLTTPGTISWVGQITELEKTVLRLMAREVGCFPFLSSFAQACASGEFIL